MKQEVCGEVCNTGAGGAGGALLRDDPADDADPDIIPNLYGEC